MLLYEHSLLTAVHKAENKANTEDDRTDCTRHVWFLALSSRLLKANEWSTATARPDYNEAGRYTIYGSVAIFVTSRTVSMCGQARLVFYNRYRYVHT